MRMFCARTGVLAVAGAVFTLLFVTVPVIVAVAVAVVGRWFGGACGERNKAALRVGAVLLGNSGRCDFGGHACPRLRGGFVRHATIGILKVT